MSKESYTHTLPGGTLETRYTETSSESTLKVNPEAFRRGGTVEVQGDGTVVDRGLKTTNGAHLPQVGLTYYSENGAKRLNASQVTDSCTVNIPGIGLMGVGAAKRMGLLTEDGTGRMVDTTKAAMDQMNDDGQQQEGEKLVSMANDETNGVLNSLDEALGREGTLAATSSVIGHLTSPKWSSPEGAFEQAGRSLANRTGVDPAVAQTAVQKAYEGYREQCVNYLNKMGADAEAVLDFASTCSQTVRADIMRAILLGRGPQALKNLVQRYKTRSRQ
jgi:hypothetical protein